MQFTWLEEIEQTRLQELFEFYKEEWWTKERSFQQVIQMLEGSDVIIGCCSADNKLIGFARVLTDFTFKAMIFDVIVREEFRGNQIGSAIINHIFALDVLKDVTSFELYCPDRLTLFYEKLGFNKGSANILFKER